MGRSTYPALIKLFDRFQVPLEYTDEFDNDVLQVNLRRSKIVAIFLLFTLFPLFYIDYQNYSNGLWVFTPGYCWLFYTHLLLLILVLTVLTFDRVIKTTCPGKNQFWLKSCLFFFFVFFLMVSAMVSIVDQKIHGEITVYIMGVLGFAVFINFRPLTSLLAYILSFAFFFAGISYLQPDPVILIANQINGALLIMVSWIISVTLFQMRVKDFINQKALEQLANNDYLTGCLNRRAFLDRLEQEIERARRDHNTISILLIDVDLFKQINDKFGHAAGDHVLRHFVECVSSACRDYDFMGRFGGEEFIICLPNTSLKVASEVAERLRCFVQDTEVSFASETISITVSVGVAALGPTFAENLDKFISRADAAMYKAKTKRNDICVSVY